MIETSRTNLRVPDADYPSAEWDRPLPSFGLTDRQCRFLVTVMRHAGVFVGRQYAAFAGITHGQKVHDFIETLLVRRLATSIELGTTGRTRIIHVRVMLRSIVLAENPFSQSKRSPFSSISLRKISNRITSG